MTALEIITYITSGEYFAFLIAAILEILRLFV